MPAPTIFNAFDVATQALSKTIYRNATWRSAWLNAIPRDTFENGRGLVKTTYTLNNSEPTTDDESWIKTTSSNITSGSPGGGDICAVAYSSVPVGFSSNTYQPEVFGLQGPILCKDDLIFDHNAERFIAGYIEELTKRAARTWEKRLESCYIQYASKYVTTSTTSGYTGTTNNNLLYSNQVATNATGAVLTNLGAASVDINQDILNGLAMELIYIGATNPDSNGFISLGEQGPVFSLLIGPEASERILKSDGTSVTGAQGSLRSDIRMAAPSELLQRMGATRVLKNFRHIPNLHPPRFGFGTQLATPVLSAQAGSGSSYTVTCTTASTANLAVGMPCVAAGGTGGLGSNAVIQSITSSTVFVIFSTTPNTNGTPSTITCGTAGAYFRVPTFVSSGANPNAASTLNPGWKTAPFEGAIAISPHVITSEIVRPVNSMAGLNWSPTSSLGEWQWVTGAWNLISSANPDPFAKYGAHFAEFRQAIRPEFPQHGFTLIFKRP